MITYLCPRTDESPFLHPKEVAERIIQAFPGAAVDWQRANVELYDTLEELEALGVDPAIIRGHKNLFNNIAYIEIDSPDDPRMGVRFLVAPDTAIEVEFAAAVSGHDDADELKRLVATIAECLDYDVLEEQDDHT